MEKMFISRQNRHFDFDVVIYKVLFLHLFGVYSLLFFAKEKV